MSTLTKEEYTDLYKMCKKLNRDFLCSLRKSVVIAIIVALFAGVAAYRNYPNAEWKFPAFISAMCFLGQIFVIFFFMPTAWLKRKIKHFPGMTYQELKRELDSYL